MVGFDFSVVLVDFELNTSIACLIGSLEGKTSLSQQIFCSSKGRSERRHTFRMSITGLHMVFDQRLHARESARGEELWDCCCDGGRR